LFKFGYQLTINDEKYRLLLRGITYHREVQVGVGVSQKHEKLSTLLIKNRRFDDENVQKWLEIDDVHPVEEL
jgi:hypothetical protein